MKRVGAAVAVASLLFLLTSAHARQQSQSAKPYTTWSAYGGTLDQIRYSSLNQINKTNVKQLTVAWSYDSGESGGLQTQPIVADGVLYGYTPTHKTFALRADTGELLWTFDSGIKGQGPNRGVMYWKEQGARGPEVQGNQGARGPEGQAEQSARGPGGQGIEARVFAAVDNFLYALDAKTGKPISTFGEAGRIDLRKDLGRDPEKQSVRLTSPGVIYKDLLIIGGRVSEGLPSSPGDVRAYDVKTGALRWSFHTIPHPGEAGYETWSKNSWKENGGANSWPGMALDEQRGIVFVPTGSAAADFYAANRVGDNLYANSLIALNADTGKRLWHFQFVRHDIWDRDPPSPPNLVTIRQNGRTIDAVAQSTKHGYVFLFDRTDGTPIYPIEYRKVPASTVPGEVAADTQPFPTKPQPFARNVATKDTLTTRTPEVAAWARERFDTFKNDGVFVPFTVGQQTVLFPGFDGGAEWGGQAFDPDTGLYYVNANDLVWTGGLVPAADPATGAGLYRQQCASCHRDDLQGTPGQIPTLVGVGVRKTRGELTNIIRTGAGRMPGFPALADNDVAAIVEYLATGSNQPTTAQPQTPRLPYRFTGYGKFVDPDGYPAVAPPWGTLSAINLNTGEFAWQIPFGEYPELVAKGLKNTGSENYGGPIVTAGGLVLIGATNFDRKFRAFDKTTGELLWETLLPFSGNATPATYEINGRQYVVIAAGGGKGARGSTSGGVYVAFALPR